MKITFSGIVHVTGEPMLALSIGAATRQAAFLAGSGTNELTFRYAVQDGDNDLDPADLSIGAGPGSLAGGQIQDSVGNDAARTFEGLAPNRRHRVDAQRPAVQQVGFQSPPANGVYLPGEAIVLAVTFSEEVHVTGQPMLVLSIGAATREAAFATGSGTRQLTFAYVVEADDYDGDGISIGAGPGSLAGGTIQDSSGNDARRNFEAIAAEGSPRVGVFTLPAQQARTLIVGNFAIIDLAETFGPNIPFICAEPCSDNPNVATGAVSKTRLRIDPVSEGSATITIVAYGQVAVQFPVVVEADAAEVAVLEDALAAIARGLLAGASNTVGARLETPHRLAGSAIVGRRATASPWPQAASQWAANPALGALGPGLPFGDAPDPGQAPQVALDRLLGRSSFEMSLLATQGTSWALWGAGDLHAFEGKPEPGGYDGSLTSAYLGMDAQGDGWIAGAAISHSRADADYDFASNLSTGKGTLETTLTVLHPYAQWSFGNGGRMWAMAGVGTGEATFARDSEPAGTVREPSDLTLRMGMAGIRAELAQFGTLELALRGDAGVAALETDGDTTALDGLAVSAQRVRVGVEAGYALATAGNGTLKPFVDIGGRYDGGDGPTGAGVEVAAGVRYRSPTVGFEAKARTLAMHGADDYAETGASAMLVVTPSGPGKGLRLSLAPRWGGSAEGQDLFWRQERVFHDDRVGMQAQAERARGKWGLAARLGYDFDLPRSAGAAVPFVEHDMTKAASQCQGLAAPSLGPALPSSTAHAPRALRSSDACSMAARQETRFGIGYKSERSQRLEFDFSASRAESPHGAEQRWQLSVSGRF